MKPLPRFPTRLGVRPALGALLLMTACGAGAQQWTAGQSIWQSGKPGQPQLGSCAQCHSTSALTAFRARFSTLQAAQTAAQNFSDTSAGSGMALLFNALSAAEKSAVAAYVADFRAEGNVSASPSAALSVPAVGQSASAVVTLFNNGRAQMVVATNNGVRLGGAGASQFELSVVGNGCQAMTLAANGGSCQVRVTYRPTAAPNPTHLATLTFEHNGEPLATTSLPITGSLSATPPPPSPPASGGGGGALSALWLALLPAALRRRRTA
jgi:cytochrome c553